LIPDSYATPFPYIDPYGNIVVTYNENTNSNYAASLLATKSTAFTPTFSLGNITPKNGEPAKIVFSSKAIHHGVIIFENSNAHSTYSSICKLFDSKDGLKFVLKEKQKAFYQKGL